MPQNAIPRRRGPAVPGGRDLAARIAERTLAGREAGYADEVRRLLDAALEVMRSNGTTSRARVAEIVAAAGLSNDAFYRHFASKDALVAALLEDGTDRLASYLAHQMGKEKEPARQVRRWVEGVLSQSREEIAAATLAVLWNGGSVGTDYRHDPSVPLGALLCEPFGALGSRDPAMAASLVAHATLGKMGEYLWSGRAPNRSEVDKVVDFAVTVAAGD